MAQSFTVWPIPNPAHNLALALLELPNPTLTAIAFKDNVVSRRNRAAMASLSQGLDKVLPIHIVQKECPHVGYPGS